MAGAPGKACQPPRAFCPAAVSSRSAKSLKLRKIAFRAFVMTDKGRKRRANRLGPNQAAKGAGQETSARGKIRPDRARRR